jgi:hypothetical protein
MWVFSGQGGGASKTVRSQAEPGNEVNEVKRLNRVLTHSGCSRCSRFSFPGSAWERTVLKAPPFSPSSSPSNPQLQSSSVTKVMRDIGRVSAEGKALSEGTWMWTRHGRCFQDKEAEP